MFEKEAEEAFNEWKSEQYKDQSTEEKMEFVEHLHYFQKHFEKTFKAGYNKANEWHYVKDEGTPKIEGHYLVCLRNKDKDIFDCWIYYDKDVGWYSLKVRMKDIYAWKEIVLPELKESK